MMCPKCMSSVPEGSTACPKCGAEIPPAAPAAATTSATLAAAAPAVTARGGSAGGILLTIAGILSSLILLVNGLNLAMLRSVAGNTIAEAYYNGVGWALIGLAFFTGPLLWVLGALLRKK